MKKIFFITVVSLMLVACEKQSEVKTPTVKRITAGTERSEAGRLIDKRTTFKGSDHTIYFDADVLNITEEIPIYAYWKRKEQELFFSTYSVMAKPGMETAHFQLEKPTDWPSGTYTLYVTIGSGASVPGRSLDYVVK